MSSSEIRCKYR